MLYIWKVRTIQKWMYPEKPNKFTVIYDPYKINLCIVSVFEWQ